MVMCTVSSPSMLTLQPVWLLPPVIYASWWPIHSVTGVAGWSCVHSAWRCSRHAGSGVREVAGCLQQQLPVCPCVKPMVFRVCVCASAGSVALCVVMLQPSVVGSRHMSAAACGSL